MRNEASTEELIQRLRIIIEQQQTQVADTRAYVEYLNQQKNRISEDWQLLHRKGPLYLPKLWRKPRLQAEWNEVSREIEVYTSQLEALGSTLRACKHRIYKIYAGIALKKALGFSVRVGQIQAYRLMDHARTAKFVVSGEMSVAEGLARTASYLIESQLLCEEIQIALDALENPGG